MTDPNDDLSSVADPGSLGPDAMTELVDGAVLFVDGVPGATLLSA
ncbi:hypothetical protein [Actinoplanes philippinensis]|nr:hypothetical protein [Actinoplanes philippinensis]